MVFDVTINSRTPEIIRNKVVAVLSNPACRVRKFSWRDAHYPEPALLPSVAKALRQCASIETVSCPSTWFCAIGDKVRNLEIWGWIDRPDEFTALLQRGQIESVSCCEEACHLMVQAMLDAEKGGGSRVHAVSIGSFLTAPMPLPDALGVMKLLRQSTLVTDLSLPSTAWVDERMVDWIAKGPIQVLSRRCA